MEQLPGTAAESNARGRCRKLAVDVTKLSIPSEVCQALLRGQTLWSRQGQETAGKTKVIQDNALTTE
jgi:hypothetical protein